jgi:hypothetical protein
VNLQVVRVGSSFGTVQVEYFTTGDPFTEVGL